MQKMAELGKASPLPPLASRMPRFRPSSPVPSVGIGGLAKEAISAMKGITMRKLLLASSLLLGLVVAGCSNPNMRGTSTTDPYPASTGATTGPGYSPSERSEPSNSNMESAPAPSDSGYNEDNTPPTPTR
jgi:hypothetical protein